MEMWKVVPKSNCFRRYRISAEPRLVGGFDLVVEWGRIGCAPRRRVEEVASMDELKRRQSEILEKRRRHGYVAVSPIEVAGCNSDSAPTQPSP